MSKKYATRLFKINQSALLIKWLVIIHILAVLAIIITPLSLIYKIIILILILISLFTYIKQALGSKGFSLRYTSAFGWETAHLNDQFESIEILPSTVLTPYVVFLHYKIQNCVRYKQKNKTAVIFKDSLINDDFRRLRVELKISGLHKPVS